MEHHLSCQYIKSDGMICGKGCWRSRGCSRHFRSHPKKLCPVCNKLTNSHIGICRIHDEIYKHVWHESKKTGHACFADICLNAECPNPINGQS